MGQNDYTIANQSFPSFRSDLNNALQAIATKNAGATEPSTTFSYQWWYDEADDVLKIRNSANDAWIEVATFDQTTDTFLSVNSKAPTVQEFTSSGTYTPSTGAKWAFVEVLGAGGAGGGTSSSTSSEGAAGGGGAGGAYCSKWIDVSALTGAATITIGAGGTGSTGSTGGDGGNSSYDDSGVGGSDTLTANGGNGGVGSGSTPGEYVNLGGSGQTATGGDLNIDGQGGHYGLVLNGAGGNADVCGGAGGSSKFGAGQRGSDGNSGDGKAGEGYGAGGSGAGQSGSVNKVGGDGTDGYIRITEYYMG